MTIFTEKDATLEEFKEDRLAFLPAAYLANQPTDNGIWRRLMAAESEVAGKIGVPLEPTEVFPVNPPTPAELAALGGRPYLIEPGYDMPGGFLGTFNWGTLQLRQRPVLSIDSIAFVYPQLNQVLYTVPRNWIYFETKAGLVQFTPAPTAAGLPSSLLAANVVVSGQTVPQMIRVRYTAGISPTHIAMPHLRDVIMRQAVMKLLQDSFLAQSGSISADGLSQSMSMDISKHAEGIDDSIEQLKQKINGPVWGVL